MSSAQHTPGLFSRYGGTRPLDETSIDDIPVAEQHAFWAMLGETGDMTDEDVDRLYSAWYAEQRAAIAEANGRDAA